jgi:hypothetical protein
MSEKINEENIGMLELRRRNLLAADFLEQLLEEEAEGDDANWTALEREIRKSDLKFHEPEDL